MTIPPNTDSYGRVPLTGTHPKAHILQEYPVWIYHSMSAGVALDGTSPATATTAPAQTDPAIHGGRADYNSLTHGGLFDLLGNYKRAVEVLVIDNEAAATLTIVNPHLSLSRSVPGTLPFVMTPGEYFKATGGTTGKKVGIQVQEYLPYR
jgi:hypothetical protein